ncbi:MAG: hypothetical protein BMS9Abin29_0632 [Gemmatimonadota bacterium]|nr:MAG: hypothetical protein BMS9Abin29_0632 [Gemmatimonadota bacterium]
MTPVGRYGATGLLLLLVVLAGLWPFLDGDGRRGIALAAAVAYPIQLLAFWLLIRYRQEMNRFLVIWAGGTLIRMAVIVGLGLWATRLESVAPVPMLLALGGFFFVLLLLEPAFFRVRGSEHTE